MVCRHICNDGLHSYGYYTFLDEPINEQDLKDLAEQLDTADSPFLELVAASITNPVAFIGGSLLFYLALATILILPRILATPKMPALLG